MKNQNLNMNKMHDNFGQAVKATMMGLTNLQNQGHYIADDNMANWVKTHLDHNEKSAENTQVQQDDVLNFNEG